MHIKTKNRKAIGTLGIVAVSAILVFSMVAYNLSQTALATPANKTTFGVSTVEVTPTTAFLPIVSGSMHVSGPSDLIVTFNHECSIHTGLNLDNLKENATSAIRQEIWLKVTKQGEAPFIASAVPSSGNAGDNGIVTMCGRAYSMDTNVLSVLNATCTATSTCSGSEVFLDSFIRTKQAHSWTWVVLDLGPGTVTVDVESRIVKELEGLKGAPGKGGKKATDGDPCASCVDTILTVGKRSLILVEDKLATGT